MQSPLAKLFNAEELAQMWDLSPATIRQWAKDRKIPCIRLGSRILFSQDDLAWILERNHVAAVGGSDHAA